MVLDSSIFASNNLFTTKIKIKKKIRWILGAKIDFN